MKPNIVIVLSMLLFGQPISGQASLDKIIGLLEDGKTNQAAEQLHTVNTVQATALEKLMKIGRLLIQQSALDGALVAFSKAKLVAPDSAIVHTNLGELYDRMGVPELAIHHLQNALALAPDQVDTWLLLGRLYHRGGNLKEAHKCFQRVADLDSTDAESRLILTGLALKQQDYAAALRVLGDYRQRFPASLQADTLWLEALFFSEQYQQIIAHTRTDPETFSGSKRLLRMAAYAHYQQQSFSSAITHWQQLSELTPLTLPEHRRLADAAMKTGRDSLAIQTLKEILQLPETPAEMFSVLGSLYLNQGLFREAAEQFRQHRERDPGNLPPRLNHGICLMSLQDWPAAAAVFQEAIEVGKNDLRPHLYLARCLVQQSSLAQAQGAYQTVISLAGSAEEHQQEQAEARRILGYISLQNDDYTGALAQLSASLTLDASSTEAHYWQARALAALNRPSEAATAYRRVLQLDPAHREAADALQQMVE